MLNRRGVMDALIVSLAALAILAVLAYRYRGTIKVKWLGMTFEAKSDKPDPPPTPKAGASIQDAQARGNIRADDRTGRGAEVKGAKAGGDITASSAPPESPPKE